MAEVIPKINIDGTKIKNTWTEKEYVTDKVYNALNKAVIDLKNNNNLLDSNSILFREEYNSSSKNLNNAIHQGVYSFTNSAVNAPSGVTGGNLFVTNTSKINQGSSVITQIAFCHNGAVYARTKNNSGNFTSWNKLAYITDNVASATKATQDSQGQQINTTYVKGLSANNATLTITKGNGTTSTATINNVANATKATQDGNGNTINTTYLKLSGGTMKGDIYFTGVTPGIQRVMKNTEFNSGITFSPDFMGFWDWRDNTRVLTYNYNKKELTTEVAINGVTPSTSDNSTKLATTAFVKSLFTANKATNGWRKEASTGFIWQWGQESRYHDVMDDRYGSRGALNFPISFPNECLLVIPYLIGSRTFCCVSVYGFTNERITVQWDEWARSVQSVKFGYIAIGY